MTRVIDELVESAPRELADEVHQRALWMVERGDQASSFEECTSRLWDDSGLADALERYETPYSAVIDQQLRELRAALRRVDGSRGPKTQLDRVRSQA